MVERLRGERLRLLLEEDFDCPGLSRPPPCMCWGMRTLQPVVLGALCAWWLACPAGSGGGGSGGGDGGTDLVGAYDSCNSSAQCPPSAPTCLSLGVGDAGLCSRVCTSHASCPSAAVRAGCSGGGGSFSCNYEDAGGVCARVGDAGPLCVVSSPAHYWCPDGLQSPSPRFEPVTALADAVWVCVPAAAACGDGVCQEHEYLLDAVQNRLDEDPQAIRRRRETVEHPFGTLKMRMGATHFLMKTLRKVATEMALHVLAYILTRVTNIVGIKPLMRAIRA